MLPTPTPIVLSGPATAGDIPLSVWLVFAVAVGLQVLLFYRRRKMALQTRVEKRHNRGE